ncbi:MAG: hypothetical protein LBL91_06235 [Lachnospiraceae bacterium]|jgi:hypothetical protein|nr:hypothetical protein [Lachnospiraceae bacterium]
MDNKKCGNCKYLEKASVVNIDTGQIYDGCMKIYGKNSGLATNENMDACEDWDSKEEY